MKRRFSVTQRRAIYTLAGGQCVNCGKPLSHNFHCDHVEPWSLGGATDVNNAQGLCAACNQRKGVSVMLKWEALRRWQQQFVLAYREHRLIDFLLVSLPAGGKTIASLWIAKEWLQGRGVKARLIIHISPLRQLKKQFQKAAKTKFNLEFQTTEFYGDIKPGMHGICFTYAGMANAAAYIRGLCARYDVLAILDEPHHMSVEAVWGRQCLEAFEYAGRRLFMTGTPWRHDMEDIPFLTRKADGTYEHHFLFDWPPALEEEPRCIRILVFRHFDDTIDYEDKETHEILSLDSRDRLTKEQQDRWLSGAIKGTDMVTKMISEAHRKLMQIRALKPDAAGLVVCEDIRAAERIAERLHRITNVRPHLIVSDDEVSEDTIDQFNDENGVWIVSVRKVSEGIDIPRLQVGVFLTNYSTELYFRQFVGRIARNQGTKYDQEAYVFMPHHYLLMEYAQKIEQLQAVALKEKDQRPLPNGGGSGAHTNYLGDHDAGLAGVLIPNRSGRTDADAIERLMSRHRVHGMTETLAARLLEDGLFGAQESEESIELRTASFDDRPLEEQLDLIRRRIIKPKVRRLAYLLGADDDPDLFRRVQIEANSHVCCHGVDTATLDQLKAMSAYLDRRLEDYANAQAQPR